MTQSSNLGVKDKAVQSCLVARIPQPDCSLPPPPSFRVSAKHGTIAKAQWQESVHSSPNIHLSAALSPWGPTSSIWTPKGWPSQVYFTGKTQGAKGEDEKVNHDHLKWARRPKAISGIALCGTPGELLIEERSTAHRLSRPRNSTLPRFAARQTESQDKYFPQSHTTN